MKKRVGVYAGSFDPPTCGHLWVIERGLELFNELIVAVGTNQEKSYTFPLEKRMAMLEETLTGHRRARVAAAQDRLLVRYAKEQGAEYMIRGLRSAEDYEYEHAMWNINHGIEPGVQTIFIPPPPELASVSSSMVKELARCKEWGELRKYVPAPVLKALKEHFKKR